MTKRMRLGALCRMKREEQNGARGWGARDPFIRVCPRPAPLTPHLFENRKPENTKQRALHLWVSPVPANQGPGLNYAAPRGEQTSGAGRRAQPVLRITLREGSGPSE